MNNKKLDKAYIEHVQQSQCNYLCWCWGFQLQLWWWTHLHLYMPACGGQIPQLHNWRFFIIFEVTGKISTNTPIYHGQHGLVNTCTFWVESLPNQVSCALWCWIPGALHALVTHIAFPNNISHVYKEDPAIRKVSLLIQWASNEPSELLNVSVSNIDRHIPDLHIQSPTSGQLPTFTHGILGLLGCLHEPQPLPVQVLFNLTHGFEGHSGKVVLATSLLTIDTIQWFYGGCRESLYIYSF